MLLVLIELRYADTPTCGMDFFKGESSSGIHRRRCERYFQKKQQQDIKYKAIRKKRQHKQKRQQNLLR